MGVCPATAFFEKASERVPFTFYHTLIRDSYLRDQASQFLIFLMSISVVKGLAI